MIFEWDEAKRLINLEKHGVDFVDASKMWNGPMLVAEDARREYGESRYVGAGRIEGRVMVVVYIPIEAQMSSGSSHCGRLTAGRLDLMKTQQMNKPAVVTRTVGVENQATSQTDWSRLDALGDDDLDYSDAPELGAEFWNNAKVLDRGAKKPITIRVDQEVVTWFKSRGGRYQVLMNQVLRQYMENLEKHGQSK